MKKQVEMYHELAEALKNDYGFQVGQIVKTEFGSAECFIVDTETGRIFVKIYQKKHDYEQISKEIHICMHLNRQGMNVSEYLENLSGDYINVKDFGIYTAQKYIHGITYEKFQVPRAVIVQSADILADIHNFLKDVEGLQTDFSLSWIEQVVKSDENVKKVERLIQTAEKLPQHEMKDRILADCRWKLETIALLPQMKDQFGELTRKNSHGDYNTYQWICEEERIKSVIDFGSCSNVPVIWELIRSYTYAGTECKNGDNIDRDFYCEYLQRYLKKGKLCASDLKQGFCFYYFTLSMSTFGYKQYMEDYLQGKYNKLIEFALWRTQMCRFLFEHSRAMDAYVWKRLKMEI